jgi:hypothetical protein
MGMYPCNITGNKRKEMAFSRKPERNIGRKGDEREEVCDSTTY